MIKKHFVTSGDIIQRLTIIAEIPNSKPRKLLASCSCNGNVKPYRVDAVYANKVASCGCLQKEVAKKTMTKHGLYKDALFLKYKSMMERCTLKDNSHYGSYVDVTVCDQWKNSFDEFKEWSLMNGFSPKLQLDRINNNLGYSPDNCRWVTATINQRNRTKSKVPTTSKYIGVCWNNARNKWVASIRYDNKTKNLGGYLVEEDAAKARDKHILDNNLEGFTLNNVL